MEIVRAVLIRVVAAASCGIVAAVVTFAAVLYARIVLGIGGRASILIGCAAGGAASLKAAAMMFPSADAPVPIVASMAGPTMVVQRLAR
jgi:hypothetical protein